MGWLITLIISLWITLIGAIACLAGNKIDENLLPVFIFLILAIVSYVKYKKAKKKIDDGSIEVSVESSEVPKEILKDMRKSYTIQQASNDIRIARESLDIMENTENIDTFLSRYETAMQKVLTLLQAKQAGIPIKLEDNFKETLISAKKEEFGRLLYRSWGKELEKIDSLKTNKGKLSRLNKYIEKIQEIYEDEIEYVADREYEDILSKAEKLKRELEAECNMFDDISEDMQQIQPTLSEADEIRKYKKLLDEGIITQEEFEAKKKQLLGL